MGKRRPLCKCQAWPKPKVDKTKAQPEAVKEDYEEKALIGEDIGEPCLDESSSGDFELVTTGHVLQEVMPPKRKNPPFFVACPEKLRFDNLIPCDVTNNHQQKSTQQKTTIGRLECLRVTSNPRQKRTPAIIATIGPSCDMRDEIEALILSGMNVARINLAFGDRCSHVSTIRKVREAEKAVSTPIAVMLALKGVPIRTGRLCRMYVKDCDDPKILLQKDSVVTLTNDSAHAERCTPRLVYVDYKDLYKFLRPEMKIYLDEIKLIVLKIENQNVICQVKEEGNLGNKKKVHVPMVPLTLPPYTPEDIDDLIMAINEDVDVVTLPRASQKAPISDLKEVLTEKMMAQKKMRERPIMVFAEISTYKGLNNVDDIIAEADGVVISRGCLGLDLPPEKLIIAQEEIIGKCNLAGKPVVCSGRFMQTMLKKAPPGRSDIADVAACIQNGADCIALTAETSIGKYPNEVIRLVDHVIREADAATFINHRPLSVDPKIAIAIAAFTIAEKTKAPAVVVLTASGKSAKLLSWLKTRSVVVAVTGYERTARQLNLWRCILPVLYKQPCSLDWFRNMEMKFQRGIIFGKESGFIRPGDPVVLVSGYSHDVGYANCVRIVYASTEPDVYLDHPLNFYTGREASRCTTYK